MRKLAGFLFLGLFSMGMLGCDSGGNQNMMEGVEESALEEYERILAEEEAAMSAAPDDEADDQ